MTVSDDGDTDVAATGTVTNPSTSNGYALDSEGDVFLQNDSVVDSYEGCVGAYGGGNVGSGGNILAGGTVDASPSATTGTITENSAPGEVPETASFGSSGNLDVQGLVELTPGDYVVNNLTVYSGGTLRSVGGQVRIYVLNNFTVQGNGRVEAANDYAGNMVFYGTSGNDQFVIQSNSTATAVIHAPDRRVTMQSNGILYGRIYGEYFELQTNARVHYDTSLDTGCH